MGPGLRCGLGKVPSDIGPGFGGAGVSDGAHSGYGAGVSTDLSGRTILITGANTGIGRAAAEKLAAAGARLLLACRSPERARGVLDTIASRHGPDRALLIPLDLADLGQIRQAAARVADTTARLDLLLNNAGLAGQRGVTRDGFETTFGVNHLGHFLLTLLLLPLLRAAGTARIVNVSSVAHLRARNIDFAALRQPTRTFTGFPEYTVSKLCNLLFTRELARRLQGTGITPCAVHPGTVATEVWRRLPSPARWLAMQFMISPEQGAQRLLHAALTPSVEPGTYYDQFQPRQGNPLATGPDLAKQLWTQSATWTATDL